MGKLRGFRDFEASSQVPSWINGMLCRHGGKAGQSFISEGCRCRGCASQPFSGKKRKNALLWPANDRLFAFYNDRALQQLLVLEQDLDHCFRIIDIILRVELQFLELGVLAHQVFHGVFKAGNDLLQCLSVRRCLDVEDNLRLDSQFPGDRQGVF